MGWLIAAAAFNLKKSLLFNLFISSLPTPKSRSRCAFPTVL